MRLITIFFLCLALLDLGMLGVFLIVSKIQMHKYLKTKKH